jgi:RNA polymerase sigma-70 factor (ECF subfamily)
VRRIREATWIRRAYAPGVTTDMKASTVPARALLDATRRGDQDAFRELVEPYRVELRAHCHRMLGSLDDAEDALQDALIRAWRGLSGFEGGKPLRPWLYRIATNASLDLLAKRRPGVETPWVAPYPEEIADGYATPDTRYELRESVELAFVAALQHLPARQRAVLILREVLGFSAREVAGFLRTSTASVNSALQRARATVDARLPSIRRQATLRSLDDERLRAVAQGYVSVWEGRDVDAIVAMLVEDATFACRASCQARGAPAHAAVKNASSTGTSAGIDTLWLCPSSARSSTSGRTAARARDPFCSSDGLFSP